MKTLATVLLAVMMTAVSGCAHHRGASMTGAGIPDDKLGLSKTSVRDTPDPIVARHNSLDPGEADVVWPAFKGAPPVIPHGIVDFLPITIEMNACMDCHEMRDAIGESMEIGDPSPMPRTHYTDLRRSPDQFGPAPVGARYVCTQCHVPQTDAAPLVENTFGE
jgi:cytochrome c-type protein NapB